MGVSPWEFDSPSRHLYDLSLVSFNRPPSIFFLFNDLHRMIFQPQTPPAPPHRRRHRRGPGRPPFPGRQQKNSQPPAPPRGGPRHGPRPQGPSAPRPHHGRPRPSRRVPRRGRGTPGTGVLVTRPLDAPTLPARDDEAVRVIPVGGFEETGARNCLAVEYKKDLILIDAGIMFPEADMPGVDYIIPDISFLRGREQDIRAMVITHAHLDHMGAVPHLLPRIGNPPVYGSLFTTKLVQKRYEDFPQNAKPITHALNPGDVVRIGQFEIEAFHEQHSVPDALGIVVRTPSGTIFITGDWKFDTKPVHDAPAALEHIAAIAKRGVTVMFGDSTSADKPGATIPEQTVLENFEKIFQENPQGRIIASTTGSNIQRLQQLLTLAVKYGRKVAIEGFSMRTNILIAQELKYIDLPKGTIIPAEETNKLPPEKVLVLCTGAQAEEQAVLMRIVHKEHRTLAIQPGDAVVFSSSAIPGNERAIENLKDYLSRQGADVYHYQMMDIHSSGHGKQEDLKEMLRLVRPEFFVPAYGNFYHRKLHGKLAIAIGIPKERVLYPDNGQVLEIRPHDVRLTEERYPINYIMVDGLGVGDLSEVVIRDRQILASDGMVVAIIKMAHRTGELIGRPDLVSRGFVYMKEQRALIHETQEKIRDIMKKTQTKGSNASPPNEAYIKAKLRDDLGQFLYNKTQRRPMIIPLLIEV